MLSLLATLLVAQTLPTSAMPESQNTWVFSTISHSEWCPAGSVMLNLQTGVYLITERAARDVCNDAAVKRRMTPGRLQQSRLVAIKRLYDGAMTEGVQTSDCANGKHANDLVVSNGGTPVLVLNGSLRTLSAPDELSCWSEAAKSLHSTLDKEFSPAKSAER